MAPDASHEIGPCAEGRPGGSSNNVFAAEARGVILHYDGTRWQADACGDHASNQGLARHRRLERIRGWRRRGHVPLRRKRLDRTEPADSGQMEGHSPQVVSFDIVVGQSAVVPSFPSERNPVYQHGLFNASALFERGSLPCFSTSQSRQGRQAIARQFIAGVESSRRPKSRQGRQKKELGQCGLPSDLQETGNAPFSLFF